MNELTAGTPNPRLALTKVKDLMARRYREGADLYDVLGELRASRAMSHAVAVTKLFGGWTE